MRLPPLGSVLARILLIDGGTETGENSDAKIQEQHERWLAFQARVAPFQELHA